MTETTYRTIPGTVQVRTCNEELCNTPLGPIIPTTVTTTTSTTTTTNANPGTGMGGDGDTKQTKSASSKALAANVMALIVSVVMLYF